MCGEQRPPFEDGICNDGSSPTCAGNRYYVSGRGLSTPVHPRVCGEQRFLIRNLHPLSGSSPRVRGTGSAPALCLPVGRFIPACAGNSAFLELSTGVGSVHPRVCGEQAGLQLICAGDIGSSPRVRGTDLKFPSSFFYPRFIPACAGNSTDHVKYGVRAAVHPRVCGEQSRCSCGFCCRNGSSPRVRGTGREHFTLWVHSRFIPACAGNRNIVLPPGTSVSVHPRVCGEQSLTTFCNSAGNGSSPRVRGTADAAAYLFSWPRFIPACAGNRSEGHRMTTRGTVHPRVCGEQ